MPCKNLPYNSHAGVSSRKAGVLSTLLDYPSGEKNANSLPGIQGLTLTHWTRKWQPTPVFLPGESQGQGSLVGDAEAPVFWLSDEKRRLTGKDPDAGKD